MAATPPIDVPPPATATRAPNRPNRRTKAFLLSFTLLASLFSMVLVAVPAAAANPAYRLEQCGNGKLGPPVDHEGCNATFPNNWVTGNLGTSKAHYQEGESIPYRAILTNIPNGAHVLALEYETLNGGKHALDYLTHFQRIAETIDPCAANTPCTLTTPASIPAPTGSPQPLNSFNALTAGERTMSLYRVGATGTAAITGVTYNVQESLSLGGNRVTSVHVAFTVLNAPSLVLAWGGHIASASDWGANNSAGGISGSSYHMRILGLSTNGGAFSGGNQDRSLGTAAVVPVAPLGASLTVVKTMANDDGGTAVPQDFRVYVRHQNGTDVAGSPQNGSAVGTSYVDLPAGTYRIGELARGGHNLTFSGDCFGPPDGEAQVTLAAGDIKQCILTNDDVRPTLVVVKHVVNDDGGDLAAPDWTLNVTGGDATPSGFAGSENGTTVRLDANAPYAVTESGPPGYAFTFSADCAGNLAVGQTKTCLVTNDDQQPTLTVVKHVINDDGGDQAAGDWTMRVDGAAAIPASFAGDEEGTLVLLDANAAYAVSEEGPAGYQATLSEGCAGTLAPGQSRTCTITNDDIQPRLMVIKHVVNDHGGDRLAAQWTLAVTGGDAAPGAFPGDEAGTEVLLDANAPYNVSESGPAGYAASFSADCAGTLAPGEAKTCIITNDDIPPRLTVVKRVVNDHGGDRLAADWTLAVNGTNAVPAAFAGDEQGTLVLLDANMPYAVTEDGPGGYAASASSDCTGTLAPGEERTCIITNDDIQPRLTVVKRVVNDDGGDQAAADWTLTVDGAAAAPASFAGDEAGVEVLLHANAAFAVSESGPDGYAATYSADCAGTLAPGEARTCTVTNDDIRPHLLVFKYVVNDDGGLLSPFDWTMVVTGAGASPASFVGDADGTDVSLLANQPYSVNETGPAGYGFAFSADCAGTLAPGETKSCIVTNDDIRPHLIVVKHVVNDDGGDQVASDWTLTVAADEAAPPSFPGDEAGTDVTLLANVPYAVSEAGPAGYAVDASADCSGTLLPGDVKTCTLTNDDIRPTLTVVKHVINDDGGDQAAADWTIAVAGAAADPAQSAGDEAGTQVRLLANAAYAVSESGPAGYNATYSADCFGALKPGDTKTCTVTNDDIRPVLTVIKHVVNDDGGDEPASAWTLTVTGADAAPAAFPGDEGGTLVSLLANAAFAVNETGPGGYTPSASAQCAGAMRPGERWTCTITNDDVRPSLVVVKHVVNDDGGDRIAADWSMGISGGEAAPAAFPGDEAGTEVSLLANAPYEVTESGPAGYLAAASADCSGTLAPGDVRTCTFTNDDIRPRLIVVKHVVNDDGGTLQAADWTLGVLGAGAAPASFAGNETGTEVLLLANAAYAVLEDGPAGYAATLSADCTGQMVPGDVKTCTVTNDDIRPMLTVLKTVVNDDGGTAAVADFPLFVGAEAVVHDVAEGFAAGTYRVSETNLPGYAATFSGACDSRGNVTLAIGDRKQCFVTNDDIRPVLIVIKHVVNDALGTQVASDFLLHVNATGAMPANFTGAEAPGVVVSLAAGGFDVREGAHAGYLVRYSADCAGVIAVGETKTCTVTNDDFLLVTRTQGFWSTHTAFAKKVFAVNAGGSMPIGTTAHLRTIDTDGKLFGAWYADIAKMTVGGKRLPVDQARMQLLQQLVTIKLNCAAFGCEDPTLDMIAQADAAYATGTAAQIVAAAAALDAYNKSGDATAIPSVLGPWGTATPALSKSLANKAFWNAP